MVCVQFTAENNAHLLHFNTFGNLRKSTVKIKRQYFTGALIVRALNRQTYMRGNFVYVYIVSLGLISIFLYVGRV